MKKPIIAFSIRQTTIDSESMTTKKRQCGDFLIISFVKLVATLVVALQALATTSLPLFIASLTVAAAIGNITSLPFTTTVSVDHEAFATFKLFVEDTAFKSILERSFEAFNQLVVT